MLSQGVFWLTIQTHFSHIHEDTPSNFLPPYVCRTVCTSRGCSYRGLAGTRRTLFWLKPTPCSWCVACQPSSSNLSSSKRKAAKVKTISGAVYPVVHQQYLGLFIMLYISFSIKYQRDEQTIVSVV